MPRESDLSIAGTESFGGRHMWRTQIRKLGKQVLMRTQTIGRHLPIGEDGQELVEHVVCKRPSVIGI
jgi:hypothetical protein